MWVDASALLQRCLDDQIAAANSLTKTVASELRYRAKIERQSVCVGIDDSYQVTRAVIAVANCERRTGPKYRLSNEVALLSDISKTSSRPST